MERKRVESHKFGCTGENCILTFYFCPKCGEQINPYDHYCKFCGQALLPPEALENAAINTELALKEAALDIAIKQLALAAKDSDACNSLDTLYEEIREYVLDKAKKELKNET